MKIALVFSGQGVQYQGMGRDLYENFEKSRNIFDGAGDEVKRLCFESSADELAVTKNTQPAVYTMTMAAYSAFIDEFNRKKSEKGPDVEIGAMAGFSLGEYAALTAAGCIPTFEAGLDIVTRRAGWMDESARDADGKIAGCMDAVIGDRKKIMEVLVRARGYYNVLVAANYNSPKQTVISGDFSAMDRMELYGKEERLRCTRLSVGGAFHSPMMRDASNNLREYVSGMEFAAPSVPLYINLNGGLLTDYRAEKDSEEQRDFDPSADIADSMALQVMRAVKWEDTVNNIIASGITTFVEIGPGKALSGLIKNINKDTVTYNVENTETLRNTIVELFR